ncbi:ferrochelatase family protein [Brugia malayi]|uniref:Ferrochelatase n=1 Tax=Brugia malayi TaxID=6279 RepID=A8P1R7_BRUMA|nr:ferrochelatase family protein [Brugia malayi]ADI33748.1 ferrochelatase 1 [Brugia malayi]CRZ22987.1 Bm1182 [Brugia malayi]VIO95488.1 ferrochelatase family protein [Brugia malayi]
MYAIQNSGVWYTAVRRMTSWIANEIPSVINEERSIPELKKKTGVLVVNVGTPSGYDYLPIRRFLREFLSDRRVIELPRILWWPILHFFILTTRPFIVGKSYKLIWNTVEDECPLQTVTRNQSAKLANRLSDQSIMVDWAFRYGEPSIASRIRKFEKEACDKLIIFPLFPQFSAVTNASIFDETCRCLMKQRRQMILSVVPPFYDNELYIKTILKHLNSALKRFRAPPQVIIVSYHGIPLSYQSSGDPYGFQCKYTTSLLRQRCRISNCELITTFQSRFGPAEWLKPYTEDTVIELAKRGVKRIMVIAPGFFSDCLETIDELKLQLADSFRKHGGEEYVYVPCLNDSTEAIDILESLSRKHIQCFL